MVESSSALQPISWAASSYWDGNDGAWNSFVVQVGDPPQDFRVYPSTAGQELWLPVPVGCTSVSPSDPGYCGYLRGALPVNGVNSSGFESNLSSTWEAAGLYTLDAQEAQLGYGGNGDYGFDTIAWGNTSDALNLTHQVVAGIADPNWWLGLAGLGPKPINFTNYNEPIPSSMSTLVNQSRIPSLSWAYTAGAYYRNRSAASLTLGGYDSNRFSGPGLSLPMNEDNSRPLQIGVQKILASNTLDNNVNLLPTATYHFIDSTIPHVWLPDESIDLCVSAFGLTYDNNTDLFLINDTVRSRLLSLNPTVTFVLSENKVSNTGPTQNIVLPYAAFDLQASYPFYQNATNYFPIRRAANDTQYTIGRTFLQEAYLIADYDRQNFTVAQTSFTNLDAERLVAIERPPQTTTNTSDNSSTSASTHSISSGAIAGIAVGALAVVTAAIILLWICIRRQKRSKSQLSAVQEREDLMSDDAKTSMTTHHISELSPTNQINEAPEQRIKAHEMHDTCLHELWSTSRPSEVHGDQSPGPLAELRGSEGQRYELAGNND